MNYINQDLLTTRQAASLLGVSTTSVQKMVNQGGLEAWITPGGHRRIFRYSVEQRLNSSQNQMAGVIGKHPLHILMVTDDSELIRLFKAMILHTGHKVRLTIVDHPGAALSHLKAISTDLLILDLDRTNEDAITFLHAVGAEGSLSNLHVATLTSIKDNEFSLEYIPEYVVRLPKTLSLDRICGYLDALTASNIQLEAAFS